MLCKSIIGHAIDVTTVNCERYGYNVLVDTSMKPGAEAAKAEGRITREFKYKVGGKTTLIFPAGIE